MPISAVCPFPRSAWYQCTADTASVVQWHCEPESNHTHVPVLFAGECPGYQACCAPVALCPWPAPAATRATHVIIDLHTVSKSPPRVVVMRQFPICWRQPGIITGAQEMFEARRGWKNGQVACARIATWLAGLSISCRKPLSKTIVTREAESGGRRGTARNFVSLLANDYSIRNLPTFSQPSALALPSHMRASPSLLVVT